MLIGLGIHSVTGIRIVSELPINYMEMLPSCEADSYSHGQEIPV
jgi:hypothetical protein